MSMFDDLKKDLLKEKFKDIDGYYHMQSDGYQDREGNYTDIIETIDRFRKFAKIGEGIIITKIG